MNSFHISPLFPSLGPLSPITTPANKAYQSCHRGGSTGCPILPLPWISLLRLFADPLHQGGIEVKKEKGMKSADVAQGEDEKRDAVNQTEESKHTTAIPG